MDEETNDMMPPGKKLPASLDEHLRALLPEKDLHHFRDQLPPEFLSDASEGLNQIPATEKLESVLMQLNLEMHKHLGHKKTTKRKRSVGDLSWTYWAIIIVLLLTIAGFLVIRMLLRH